MIVGWTIFDAVMLGKTLIILWLIYAVS